MVTRNLLGFAPRWGAVYGIYEPKPAQQGIYGAADANDTIHYIGQSSDISRRLGWDLEAHDHYQDFVAGGVDRFWFEPTDLTEQGRLWLEERYRAFYSPPLNHQTKVENTNALARNLGLGFQPDHGQAVVNALANPRRGLPRFR